ncbi:MAG: hypothetical protein K0S55_1038 [Clostridia bacterium]|nr:hypothetical protein [Clostridia bacterium]
MELSLEHIISIIIKNIIFIIITSIIFFSSAYVLTKYFIKPIYISSIKMCVISGDDSDVTLKPNINDLYYAQQVINTYIEILKTDNFFSKIADETGLGYSTGDLKNMVAFKVLNNTEIFQVDISSESPSYAKFIADSISLNAPLQIKGIKERDSVKLVQPAELPIIPTSPSITINSAIGFFLGIVFSVIIVIFKEILDIRVKGIEDLSNKYDIPILGIVPVFNIKSRKKE